MLESESVERITATAAAISTMAKMWDRFIEVMNMKHLADDPRFATFKARLANREALTELLDAALMRRTTAEWIERLSGSVPVAPVYDVAQALASEFVAERVVVGDEQHPVAPVQRPLHPAASAKLRARQRCNGQWLRWSPPSPLPPRGLRSLRLRRRRCRGCSMGKSCMTARWTKPVRPVHWSSGSASEITGTYLKLGCSAAHFTGKSFI